MDYGNTGQGGLNLFDPEMAVEMSSLQTPLQTLPRMNVDWDGGFPELTNQPAGPPGGVYPAPTAMAYPHVGGDIGFGGLCGPVPEAFDALAGTIGGGGGGSSSSIGVKPEGMLAIAHNSTRAARNGREQQRAQKISDVIDKLKASRARGHYESTAVARSHLPTTQRCMHAPMRTWGRTAGLVRNSYDTERQPQLHIYDTWYSSNSTCSFFSLFFWLYQICTYEFQVEI